MTGKLSEEKLVKLVNNLFFPKELFILINYEFEKNV